MAVLPLNNNVFQALSDTLVSPELLRRPSIVLVEIGYTLYYLKSQQLVDDNNLTNFIRMRKIKDVRQEDFSWLNGKMVILDEHHFNLRGQQLLKEIERYQKQG